MLNTFYLFKDFITKHFEDFMTTNFITFALTALTLLWTFECLCTSIRYENGIKKRIKTITMFTTVYFALTYMCYSLFNTVMDICTTTNTLNKNDSMLLIFAFTSYVIGGFATILTILMNISTYIIYINDKRIDKAFKNLEEEQ